MNGYGGYSSASLPAGFGLTLEVIVAVVITLVVLVSSLMTLNESYRDTSAWHVHFGAAIYGALFGVVVGFVIVPLRLVLTSGSVPPQTAGYASLVFLVVMVALRRGLLGRLPFLGPQVRAYRRAALRRSIEKSQQQLAKLLAKSGMGGEAPA